MNKTVERKFINDSISFLESSNLINQDNINDLNFLNHITLNENYVINAVNKYISLTSPKFNDEESLIKYKENLKESFVEYSRKHNVEFNSIHSIENLAKVAFFRLTKVCKRYYIDKYWDADFKKLEELTKTIKNLKQDYKLIKNAN